MLRIFVLTLAMIVITAVFGTDPAQAQATRTWVSGVGDESIHAAAPRRARLLRARSRRRPRAARSIASTPAVLVR